MKKIFRLLTIMSICFIFFNSTFMVDERKNLFLETEKTIQLMKKDNYSWENFKRRFRFNYYKLNKDSIGHFIEYCLLGISLSLLYFKSGFLKEDKYKVLFLIILISVLDEFYQGFIKTRGPSVEDIMTDFAGGIFGILIFFNIFTEKHYKNDQSKNFNIRNKGYKSYK